MLLPIALKQFRAGLQLQQKELGLEATRQIRVLDNPDAKEIQSLPWRRMLLKKIVEIQRLLA